MISKNIQKHKIVEPKLLNETELMSVMRMINTLSTRVNSINNYRPGRESYFITGSEGAELIQERISWLGRGTVQSASTTTNLFF